MSKSKPYPKSRMIFDRNEYFLILPENYESLPEKMPLFCGVCGIVFSSKDDEKTYKLFKCCSPCADTWAYSHKEDWNEGWRPSKDQIEIAVQKRLFVNPNIVFE